MIIIVYFNFTVIFSIKINKNLYLTAYIYTKFNYIQLFNQKIGLLNNLKVSKIFIIEN